ncbi:MAG: hypothetical protein KDC38_17405, partial [Planctomycetes bacterium]|nr:hypothetical protein [Planctomycetota bacterium]
MCRRSYWLWVVVTLFVRVAPPIASGQTIGFEEEFALADDRAKALEKLIPGTEEHDYYRSLLALQAGEFDRVEAIVGDWPERHGRTERYTRIRHRLALQRFALDPEGTFAYLIDAFDLEFDHQRDAAAASADLPTRLDPALLDLEAWVWRTIEEAGFDSISSADLWAIADRPLNPSRARQL